MAGAVTVGSVRLVTSALSGMQLDAARSLADEIKARFADTVAVLALDAVAIFIPINPENAEKNPPVRNAKGTSETPAPVSVNTADAPKSYAVLAKNGEAVVLRTIADATLTISNADGIKVVANNGTEYVADANGKITVVITANQNFTVTYDGEDAERAIYFTFVEYFG
jgi:hypothetical protein